MENVHFFKNYIEPANLKLSWIYQTVFMTIKS